MGVVAGTSQAGRVFSLSDHRCSGNDLIALQTTSGCLRNRIVKPEELVDLGDQALLLEASENCHQLPAIREGDGHDFITRAIDPQRSDRFPCAGI